MKNVLSILMCLGLIGLLNPCYAGPPYNVDAPGTAEYHRFNVKIGFLSSQNASGEKETFPSISVAYGYSKRLELYLAIKAIGTHSIGKPYISGFGNTTIGAKWRFLKETRNIPQLALGYRMILPTADVDRRLGSGATDNILWLTESKTFGRWIEYCNVGYNFLAGNTGKSSLFWGTVLTYQLTETLTVGGQVYGNSASANGKRSELAWGLGLNYNFAPDRSFQFAVGKSDHGFSDLNVYAGVAFTVGK